MCRWLAYSGPPIALEDLLTRPEHSLLDQSRHARLNRVGNESITTNGDGFGVGWYGVGEGPGLFRDLRPAWANENLQSLAAHLRSPLFLAHVRAASTGHVQETNCHPFRHGRWLFQHNGGIAGFSTVRRSLQMRIAPELYSEIEGTTDSETCFLLALSHGLEHDVPMALRRMVADVDRAQQEHGIPPSYSFACAITDGESLWAIRHASPGSRQKTLFVSQRCDALRELDKCYETFPETARVLVSEPLDTLESHWHQIPDSSLVRVEREQVEITPFEPGRL